MLEEAVGFGGFAQGKLGGDDRLDLTGGEQVEEFGKVFAEPVGVLVTKSFYVVPKGVPAAGKQFEQAERGEAEARGQLPCREGGAGAIADQCAAAAQGAVGSQPVFPTDWIKDTIYAAGNELLDAFHEIFGAVIDGRRAERGDEFVLRFRSSAEHFEAGDFAELESGGADAAGCAVDEERLAGVDVGKAVEHLVGGDVVEDEADGFGGIEICGDGDEMGGGNDEIGRAHV